MFKNCRKMVGKNDFRQKYNYEHDYESVSRKNKNCFWHFCQGESGLKRNYDTIYGIVNLAAAKNRLLAVLPNVSRIASKLDSRARKESAEIFTNNLTKKSTNINFWFKKSFQILTFILDPKRLQNFAKTAINFSWSISFLRKNIVI